MKKIHEKTLHKMDIAGVELILRLGASMTRVRN
jgi:hypothetical protein